MRFSGTVRVTQLRKALSNSAIVGGVLLENLVDENVKRVSVSFPFGLINPEDLEVGQHWKLVAEGVIEVAVSEGFKWRELALVASEASLTQPSGKHIIRWMTDCVDNIGTVTANRLWDRFGQRLFELLDANDAGALREIIGSEATLLNLLNEWRKNGDTAALRFFATHKIPAAIGSKAWKAYGPAVVDKITSDPYRLLSLWGNWESVDRLARSEFGVPADDGRRVRCAVEQAAHSLFEDGHTMSADKTVLRAAKALLDAGGGIHIEPERLLADGASAGCFAVNRLLPSGERVVHPLGAWLMEKGIFSFLSSSDGQRDLMADGLMPLVINDIEEQEGASSGRKFCFNDEQRQAVEMALSERISVLSGGAGTGKTTVLKAIVAGLEMMGYKPTCMALTGMAASRITQATGEAASTIASFVLKAQKEPVPAHIAVIIDEASMLDVFTFYRLIRVLPTCKMIFVGDAGQLPPVGPGLVFHGLEGRLPYTELKVVKRQDSDSGIPAVALSVRSGQVPKLASDKQHDVQLIECPREEIIQRVLSIYDEFRSDAQVLCPTKASPFGGVDRINNAAALRYTAGMADLLTVNTYLENFTPFAPSGFKEGDLVVFTKNDWSRDLQNGSLGKIVEAYDSPRSTDRLGSYALGMAEFNDRLIEIMSSDVEHLQLSYALTVHKSQGSQFGTVIYPLYQNKFADQTLLYTAITRAQKRVTLGGDPKALADACSRSRRHDRRSGLQAMLKGHLEAWAA